MDVNERERLSNVTLRHNIKVEEHCFYCCSTFHSHSKVFNNENNSYAKNECETAPSLQWVVLVTSADKCHLWASSSFNVICCMECYFQDARLSTKTQLK